jgi:lysozyme family protein
MIPDSIFEQSHKWERENGTTNDPADKGGWTNDGITYKHFYSNCKVVLGVEPTDDRFENMSLDDVKLFYNRIWERMMLDKVDNALIAGVCFDFALNSGYGKREIQEVLMIYGFPIAPDNIFGPKTIAALNKAVIVHGVAKVSKDILDQRLKYVQGLVKKTPSQVRFIKGWTNRINDWRNYANNYVKTLIQYA